MVDITIPEAIYRFPWTYSIVYDKDGNFYGYRVRLDFIIVENPDDSYKLDMYHFTSLSDRMDNAQLAKDCGLAVDFGNTYIIVSQRRFVNIFNQIIEHEKLCASHLTI